MQQGYNVPCKSMQQFLNCLLCYCIFTNIPSIYADPESWSAKTHKP